MFNLIESKNIEKLRDLISSLPDQELTTLLSAVDATGGTVLHAAAHSGDVDIMHEILGLNVDLEKKDSHNRTALDIAESVKNTDIVTLLKTRLAWSDYTKQFKFNQVMKLMEFFLPALKPADKEELVMIIGNTGSGKSTLVNYLMGCQYQKAEFTNGSGKKYAKLIQGEEKAPVGHSSVTSQTLCPQVISKPKFGYVYCDLAGLLDSRGIEEKICAVTSAQIISQLGSRIKCLLVVIEHPSFLTSREDLCNSLLQALYQIVREDLTLIKTSVCFVITKAPTGVTVQGIVKEFFEFENMSPGPIRSIVEMIRAESVSMCIADVFDKGASGRMLEELVRTSSAQVTESFRFTQYDGAEVEFVHMLEKMRDEFLTRKHSIDHGLPNIVWNEKTVRAMREDEIEKWRSEIRAMQQQKEAFLQEAKSITDAQLRDLQRTRECGEKTAHLQAAIDERNNKLIPDAQAKIIQSLARSKENEQKIELHKIELKVNRNLFVCIAWITSMLRTANTSTNVFLKEVDAYYPPLNKKSKGSGIQTSKLHMSIYEQFQKHENVDQATPANKHAYA